MPTNRGQPQVGSALKAVRVESREEVLRHVREIQADLHQLLHNQTGGQLQETVGNQRDLARRKVRSFLYNPACQLLACLRALDDRPEADISLDALRLQLQGVRWGTYVPRPLRPGTRPSPLDDAVLYLWGLLAEVSYRKQVLEMRPSLVATPLPASNMTEWALELMLCDARLRTRLGEDEYRDNRVYHIRLPTTGGKMFSRKVLTELQLRGMPAPGVAELAEARGVTLRQLAPWLFDSAGHAKRAGASEQKVKKEISYVEHLYAQTLGHRLDPFLLKLWHQRGYLCWFEARRPGTVAYYLLQLAWHQRVTENRWGENVPCLHQAVLFAYQPKAPTPSQICQELKWNVVDVRCLNDPTEAHADTVLWLTPDACMRWWQVAPNNAAVPVLETSMRGTAGPAHAQAHLAGLRGKEVGEQKPLWSLQVVGTADAEQVACTRTLCWRADSPALSRKSVCGLFPPGYTTALNRGGKDLQGVWLALQVAPGFVTRKGIRLPAVTVRAFRADRI